MKSFRGASPANLRWTISSLGICVAALLGLGMVMLYSSSMVQVGARYLMMQLVWCGIGLAACLTAASLDYRHLKKISWALLAFAVALLILVLVPAVGLKINGARRWIGLGGFRFQPSELAKLALIIALAHYAERNQRHMTTWVRGIAIPAAFIALVLGLIFAEPDYGTTLLLAAVSAALLLIAGVRWRFFLPVVLAGLTMFALSVWHNPTRLGRVLAFLHPEKHQDGVGYQSYQAMLALGSGGWTGLGLGNGRQKLGFVPEHHTDFILSIIGEELGLVATLAVVGGFLILVICGCRIAWRSRDVFGMLLASGITFLVGLQASINIGVVTSALPNKGLPLPFISYGGSNLLMMLASAGILISIARHAVEPRTEPAETLVPNELPQSA